MPPFRINSKAFFLTYPQCDVLPEQLGHHLESLGTTTYVLVAQELHADGNFHLHALVTYLEKKNIRDANYFDYEESHCNAQSTRSRSDVRKYILKSDPVEEAFYTSGEFEEGTAGGASRAAWLRAATATTAQEVMQAVLEASPRDYVVMADKVAAFAQSKEMQLQPYVHPPEQVFPHLPLALTNYITGEFTNPVSTLPPVPGRGALRAPTVTP